MRKRNNSGAKRLLKRSTKKKIRAHKGVHSMDDPPANPAFWYGVDKHLI